MAALGRRLELPSPGRAPMRRRASASVRHARSDRARATPRLCDVGGEQRGDRRLSQGSETLETGAVFASRLRIDVVLSVSSATDPYEALAGSRTARRSPSDWRRAHGPWRSSAARRERDGKSPRVINALSFRKRRFVCGAVARQPRPRYGRRSARASKTLLWRIEPVARTRRIGMRRGRRNSPMHSGREQPTALSRRCSDT